MFKTIRKMMGLDKFPDETPRDEPEPDKPEAASVLDMLSTHGGGERATFSEAMAKLKKARPVISAKAGQTVSAMDSCDDDTMTDGAYADLNLAGVSDALASWYASQGFIGHQLAATIAQHWLVAKVCAMPARDAIRQGFSITSIDGEDIDAKTLRAIKRADRNFGLRKNMLEFIHMGRVFGVRICIFKVDYGDAAATKEAYFRPFNPDGVKPGSYQGMVQVDPYWCAPELDGAAASRPDSMNFHEPTWWNISGTRYHRSHLVIFRNGELADILKPAYLYGGIPIPQLIMERVYGAERTANEAPLLALTKRTTIFKTDLSKALANFGKFSAKILQWSRFWSNNGIRVIGEADELQQIDTALADFDALIMTQYQLVAAAGEVPATKLLQTAPKGFNATGEFDEASYRESLESIQTHNITPLVERHHLLVLRSFVPESKELDLMTTINWLPLDSPTAKERADTNLVNAQTDAVLIGAGVIGAEQVYARLQADPDCGYETLDDDDKPGTI